MTKAIFGVTLIIDRTINNAPWHSRKVPTWSRCIHSIWHFAKIEKQKAKCNKIDHLTKKCAFTNTNRVAVAFCDQRLLQLRKHPPLHTVSARSRSLLQRLRNQFVSTDGSFNSNRNQNRRRTNSHLQSRPTAPFKRAYKFFVSRFKQTSQI